MSDRLTISIDRASKSFAIFDGASLVKDFQQYEIESLALAEARWWCAEKSEAEPEIVFPRITSMRIS